MARVSRGVTARTRHKKVIKRAKGYYGRRKNYSCKCKIFSVYDGINAYR